MAHELGMGDDGILRVVLIGYMGKEEAEAFVEDTLPFRETVTEAEPLRVLWDASQAGKTSWAGRKAYNKLNSDRRVGKVAAVGANRYTRVLGSFVLKATGRDNIHFFDSEEEAMAWLMAES
jgi:hypothetical protein